MIMENGNDILIKNKFENLFVKKEIGEQGLSQSEIAALITAASVMAIPVGIMDSLSASDALIDLYQVNGRKEVINSIGMSPNFVKKNIGYSVDFNDFSAAEMAYHSQKEQYDEAYQMLNARIFNQQAGIHR